MTADAKSGGSTQSGQSGRIGRADSAYHDAIAARFDASYDAHPDYAYWWAARIADLAWPRIQDTPSRPHVLDVGAGPGRLAAAFQEYGAEVTAIDHSPAMVKLAGSRIGADRAILAGGDDLPFPQSRFDLVDRRFDLAILFGILHHAVGEGPAVAAGILAEAARVARCVVVVEPNILHPYFFATTYLWHGLQERIAGYPRVEHERPFGLKAMRRHLEFAGLTGRVGRMDACRAYGSRLRLPWPFTSHIYAVARPTTSRPC